MTTPKTAAALLAKAEDARLTAEEAAVLVHKNDPELLRAAAAEAMAEAEAAEAELLAAQSSATDAVQHSTEALEATYRQALGAARAYLDFVRLIAEKRRPADEAARATARRLGVEILPPRPEPFATRAVRDRNIKAIADGFAQERLTW